MNTTNNNSKEQCTAAVSATHSGSSKTKMMIMAAVFAALTAVCSQIQIPLAPVPINLATFAIFITAGLLGKRWGTVSLIVYVLLGAVGLPVFAGFTGGFGIITGPTGGYIIGYIFTAFITGYIIEFFSSKKTSARVAEYSANAYSESLVSQYQESYEAIVEGFLSKEYLRDVDIATPSQVEMLDQFNQTDVDYDDTQTIVSLFGKQAKATPDSVAVVYKDKRYKTWEGKEKAVKKLLKEFMKAITTK